LECWSVGVLEYWSIGVLEYWSIGVLEYWSTGVLKNPKFQPPNNKQIPNSKRQIAMEFVC
jgi:hypothetical protein